MRNLQIRIDDEDVDSLDEVAKDLDLLRSEVARKALREGIRRLRLERALTKYLSHEFTLCRAAEYARIGIYEMSQAAAERGIPFFRYSPEEAKRDAALAKSALKG